MYHNNELMNSKLNLVIEDESLTIPTNIVKCRFSEIDIGRDFLYNGELVIKKSKYNAISKRKTNKHEYLFFGNEIVKIYNKEENSEEVVINNNEQLDGIDKVIKNIPFKKSSLNLIQSLSGNGKTTLSLHLAAYYIKNNHKVLFLQHDLRFIDIINRIKRLTKLDNPQENIHIFSIPFGISCESLFKNIKSIANFYDIIIYDGIHFQDNARYRNKFYKQLHNISIVNDNTIILTDYYHQLYSLNSIFSMIYTIEKKNSQNKNLELLFTKQKNRFNLVADHTFSCNLSLDCFK